MGIFRDFPYTNFHEMNLDQLIKIVDRLSKEWADFQVDWNNDVAAQVDAWLTAHPEATTTVLDGAISTAKLADGAVTFAKASNDLLDGIYNGLHEDVINGVTLRKNMLKDSSYGREFILRKPLIDYTGDATYTMLQSAEYISTTNHVILGFVKNTYDLGMLVEVSADFETVYNRVSGLGLGHLNDMAYNPHDNNIYVACMDTGNYPNKIAVVDAATLAIVSPAIDLGAPVYQISYDPDNRVFYVRSTKFGIYDEDFNEITSTSILNIDTVIDVSVTNQGSAVYNGNYMLLSQNNDFTYINTFNYKTGMIEQVQEYRNGSYIDEAEALVSIPSKQGLYIVSGQRYISVSKLKMREDSSDFDMFDIFNNGLPIPTGADLNDYYEAGKYFSESSAISGTLVNVPTPCSNRGFSLYVLNHAKDWLMQFIVGNSVKNFMLFRTKEGTNAWGAWQYLYPHAEVLDSNPVEVGDSVTIPADNLLHYDTITVSMNRNNYAGSVVVTSAQIRANDCNNGMCIFCANDKYWEFTISSAGVITLTAESGLSDPYIRVIYN